MNVELGFIASVTTSVTDQLGVVSTCTSSVQVLHESEATSMLVALEHELIDEIAAGDVSAEFLDGFISSLKAVKADDLTGTELVLTSSILTRLVEEVRCSC